MMKRIFLLLAMIFVFSIKSAYADVKVGAGVGNVYGGMYGVSAEYANNTFFDKSLAFSGALGIFDGAKVDKIGWNIGIKYYFRQKSFNPFIAYHAGVYRWGYNYSENDLSGGKKLFVSPLILSPGFSWKFYKEASIDLELGYVLVKYADDLRKHNLFGGLGFHYNFN